jgi:ComF family protein
MLRIIEKILSFVFPGSQEVGEMEEMSKEKLFEKIPKATEMPNKKFKALFQYKDKFARRAIWEIKYRGNRKIVEKFSELLYEFIIDEVSDLSSFSNFINPLLVPVPSGKRSSREKGFNQCELITKELIRLDKEKIFDYSYGAVKKIRETKKQSEIKNRSERLKNLSGSFSANQDYVKGRCIIIIDDVITTSATMTEISKILREAGAKDVVGFAIAH